MNKKKTENNIKEIDFILDDLLEIAYREPKNQKGQSKSLEHFLSILLGNDILSLDFDLAKKSLKEILLKGNNGK